MENNGIAIAYSQNQKSANAAKELSLGIKSTIITKTIHLALIFFTPNYNPWVLKKTLSITLRPKNIYGIQSPVVTFQNKVMAKGVVCCCLNLNDVYFQGIFTKETNPNDIESLFRKMAATIKGTRRFLLAGISPSISANLYLRALTFALGKNLRMFSAGFIKKYGVKNFFIMNDDIGEGAIAMLGSGNFTIYHKRISGFIPIGKPFIITRVNAEKNIVLAINHQPAALIYKKYLGNKFELFKKTSLNSLYPLGINRNGNYRIINILDILEDDSLFCQGKINSGDYANIMMATPQSLLEAIRKSASYIRKNYRYDLVIIINSQIGRAHV